MRDGQGHVVLQEADVLTWGYVRQADVPVEASLQPEE